MLLSRLYGKIEADINLVRRLRAGGREGDKIQLLA